MTAKIRWHKTSGCERITRYGRWTVSITKYRRGDMHIDFLCDEESFDMWCFKGLRASQRRAERILMALTQEEDKP